MRLDLERQHRPKISAESVASSVVEQIQPRSSSSFVAMLKSIALLSCFSLTAALAPGDCAFVGIYGDQDDFALVLMEDNEGETLFLTEELPRDNHFQVNKFAAAKSHVSSAKRGSVLRKVDFDTDSSSFVAPTALTVFSGSSESPTALCSINLEAKPGTVARKLNEEVSVVMLGLTETAQYAGSTSGSKDQLLEDISNPSNWLRDGHMRKLAGFSIATAANVTDTETTSMKPGNMTMTMTTTMTTVITVTGTTTMTAEASRTVVSGCTDLGGAVESLVGSEDATAAFTTAIAGVVSVPTSYVQNVVFTAGSSCGARRLDGQSRRLQTTGTVTYDLVFPAELGAAGSQAAAQQAITTLSTVTVETVSTAFTTAIATYTSLAGVEVTVEAVQAPVITESAGTSPEPTDEPDTTTTDDDEHPPDAACETGAALGLLVSLRRQQLRKGLSSCGLPRANWKVARLSQFQSRVCETVHVADCWELICLPLFKAFALQRHHVTTSRRETKVSTWPEANEVSRLLTATLLVSQLDHVSGSPAASARQAELKRGNRTMDRRAGSQWALPDLNCERQIAVGTAGPQLRAPDRSGHCRTSTASPRFQWALPDRSQWALPDLNREPQIPVGTARPQPRAPDCSGHCRTSTAR
eukprot:s181_g21.t1